MQTANQSRRLQLYQEAAGRMNEFCSRFLTPYCIDCRNVIARLPEAAEEDFALLDGTYPGCCHRGAGEVFRLEGQPPGRDRLAPEIIAGLALERGKVMARPGLAAGGEYRVRRRRDGKEIRGAHCRYFSARGCLLGALKGPLCLDFICPPIRIDLLEVCGDRPELIGPENDFLHLYRLFASISHDPVEAARSALDDFARRLREVERRCREFLRRHKSPDLKSHFSPAPTGRQTCVETKGE